MNLTIKSRDGLHILQKIYEGYENTNTKKSWQINSVDDSGTFTEIAVKFNPASIHADEESGLIKMMAIELLRIKQKQHLKKYKIDMDNIFEHGDDDSFITNDALAVALDTAESAYYISLITILLSEYLRTGNQDVDLSAFARFNLKDFNVDFDDRVKELKEIKREIEEGGFSFENIVGEDWDGSIVGNPFEILKAIHESFITKESQETVQETDILVVGKQDGSFDVYNGDVIISREDIEENIGFSFEIVEDDTEYNFSFENSMIVVLYALIFLKTKIIYIDDKFKKNLKYELSSYLENAGVYPEYSPYIIDRK